MTREENLEHLLGFYSPDPSVWERPQPGDIPRWATVERDDHKNDWIAFFNDTQEALDYFFIDEGGWMPVCIYDLDSGKAYEVVVSCMKGEETGL